MRAGICAVPQYLTSEAESTVKQAVNHARRRGHAQVTPLHVASAMLASSNGLLRRACLHCHSHPLQCKALELCFNVALNRLPAASPSHLLGPHYPKPSLSNALIAAFKRAQAHQRRGSIENQQQPILALKIELEQLIISILDDPSVSRVMREAGFSSTQVKNRVEQAVEVSSQSPLVGSHSKEVSSKTRALGTNVPQASPFSHFGFPASKPFDQKVRNDDVMSVLEELSNKGKRNTVIVGECLATVESVVRGLVDKFEIGNVPRELKNVQFLSFPLFSSRNLSKEEIDQKLMELRCIAKSYTGRGVVLYLGDLKWVSEFWSNYAEQRTSYSPVEQIIMEMKRLVCSNAGPGRFWLMGIASFQTYMGCKKGQPSLETIWELHPFTIPAGSLTLSLNLDSKAYSEPVEKEMQITAPTSFLKIEPASPVASKVSGLPFWLQQCREETRRNDSANQDHPNGRELCPKWDYSISSSANKVQPGKAYKLSSSSSPSNSISPLECSLNLHRWAASVEPKQPKEYQFWISENGDEGSESNSRTFLPQRYESKPELLSNPNSSPNSASSSEVQEDTDGLQEFKELNDENLKILCDSLEKRVPWQSHTIPELAKTILQCRSGMRKGEEKEEREESWLLFQGPDSKAKEKIGRELAKLIFGSQSNFVSIGLSSFSCFTEEESRNKRARAEMGSSYLQRFAEAVNENPHRVFFMEDIEQADYCSKRGIKQAIENGTVNLADSEPFPLQDAIIIFNVESLNSASSACSTKRPKSSRPDIEATEEEADHDDQLDEKSTTLSLDLNVPIEDHDSGDEQPADETGVLETVDGKFLFNVKNILLQD